MPTVAVFPSIRTHSCSLVYSRFAGFATGFLLLLQRTLCVWTFVKRERHDGRDVSRTANLDRERRADRCGFFAHKRGRDVLPAKRRRERAASHLTDVVLVEKDAIPFA